MFYIYFNNFFLTPCVPLLSPRRTVCRVEKKYYSGRDSVPPAEKYANRSQRVREKSEVCVCVWVRRFDTSSVCVRVCACVRACARVRVIRKGTWTSCLGGYGSMIHKMAVGHPVPGNPPPRPCATDVGARFLVTAASAGGSRFARRRRRRRSVDGRHRREQITHAVRRAAV